MTSLEPMIILLHGHTASGKSTLARKLGKRLPAHAIHSALVRRELGIELPGRGGYSFDLRDPVFVDTISRQVYERLITLGEQALVRGESVVFDAAFNFYRQRVPVYELAVKHGLSVHAIRCVCRSDAEVRQRLELRVRQPDDAFNEASEYATYESTRRFAEDIALDWEKPLGPASLSEYDSSHDLLKVVAQHGSIPRELLAFSQENAAQPLELVGGA